MTRWHGALPRRTADDRTVVNIALWAVQAILAAVFAGVGFAKVTKSNAELQPRIGYVEDFTDQQITMLGVAELLGAIGVVVPWAIQVAPVLTPVAALGLLVVMVGAVIVHVRRDEAQMILLPAALGLAAAFVAFGRF